MEQLNMENPKNEQVYEKPSLFGVIWSPIEQFEKIRNRPTIWIPLLVVSILSFFGTYLTFNQMDVNSILGDAGMSFSDQEMEMITDVVKIIGAIVGLISPIIASLITATIYLIISKIASSKVTFKALFSMTIFIMLISAIGSIVNALIMLALGEESLYMVTSLASVMDSDNAVLGSIELFSIWGVILAAFGLQKVAGLSKSLSWSTTIVIFFIGLFFSYIGSLANGTM